MASTHPVRTPTATIAAGESLSGAVYIGHGMIIGIQMPAAWTAAGITFQASVDGATFNDVYDNAGNEVTVTAAASRFITIDEFKGGPWIKLRSGPSAPAVNQVAAAILTLQVQALPIP